MSPETDMSVRCRESRRTVAELVAISERWGFWSDGCGALLPFCPRCAEREFGRHEAQTKL
jgi:hypothetical protein